MLKKLCAHPGCNMAVPFGERYCQKHAEDAKNHLALSRKRYDKSARNAQFNAFYTSRPWIDTVQHVNDMFHGLCVWSCMREDIATADEVHHIIPLRDDWDKRLNVSNLIPLSHAVHMRVEAAYRHGEKSKSRMQSELFGLLRKWNEKFGRARGC